MPDMHVIRLRGPWEYEPLAHTFIAADGTRHESTESLPPRGRVHLPADWGTTLGPEFRGRVPIPAVSACRRISNRMSKCGLWSTASIISARSRSMASRLAK